MALQCLEAMRHRVQTIRADAETLQVSEVSPLFHLDAHVGNAGFFEQRRHLAPTTPRTPQVTLVQWYRRWHWCSREQMENDSKTSTGRPSYMCIGTCTSVV